LAVAEIFWVIGAWLLLNLAMVVWIAAVLVFQLWRERARDKDHRIRARPDLASEFSQSRREKPKPF